MLVLVSYSCHVVNNALLSREMELKGEITVPHTISSPLLSPILPVSTSISSDCANANVTYGFVYCVFHFNMNSTNVKTWAPFPNLLLTTRCSIPSPGNCIPGRDYDRDYIMKLSDNYASSCLPVPYSYYSIFVISYLCIIWTSAYICTDIWKIVRVASEFVIGKVNIVNFHRICGVEMLIYSLMNYDLNWRAYWKTRHSCKVN